MKTYNIDDYDVFVFDFDGTIMDTEFFHYSAYIKAMKTYKHNLELNIQDYFKLLHNIDRTEFNYFIKIIGINNFNELYKKKAENYQELIHKNYINSIGNIESFLQKIKEKNKISIIVTNSSIKSIQIFKNKYPIFNYFDKIYTKEDFTKKKPDPECYLKIQNMYNNKKIVGFEDSYQGFHALYQAKNIVPFHISSKNYYYNEFIKNNYDVNVIENYNCFI